MARQRIAIPFGGGLDRYTGPAVVDRTAQEDVRNVHLADGWAHVRRGSVQVAELPGDVVAGEQLRTEDVLILVVYDADTREVHVYRAASDGTNPLQIGKWFDLHESADEPPRVFMAEVAGLMFMAHDEEIFSRRAPTFYYDPIAGTLKPLEAEWAHEGGIRFRGVTAHLGAYLAGWGYGTADEARPELVRMSMPGEPTRFHPKFYEPIGQRGEAVIRCVSTGRTLVCFTSAQTWEHFGSDRSTFGARPADTKFGLAASRLAIEIDGAVYFWSRTGPRRTTGGLSEDLALPLDLRGPSPADLVAEGATAYGFATYYPDEEEVLWVFGKRVYAFSLRTGRWRYDELPWAPVAAILSQPGVNVDPGYEPGVAVNLRVVEDVAAGVLRDVTIAWDNVEMIGDEILEFWLNGGTGWTLSGSAPVEPQEDQQHTFAGLAAGETYRLQIRARRGTFYREEYQSSNPDDWPEESLLEFTTGLAAPSIESAVWSRTSATQERIRLTIHPVYSDRDVQILRDGSVIATVTPSEDPFVYDDVSDDEDLEDPNNEWGEQLYTYVVRHVYGENRSADSEPVSRWAGPDAPTITQLEPSIALAAAYEIRWQNAETATEGWVTQILDRNVTQGDPTFALVSSLPYPMQGPEVVQHSDHGGEEYEVQIRHAVTAFGVTDFSQVSGPFTVTLSPW